LVGDRLEWPSEVHVAVTARTESGPRRRDLALVTPSVLARELGPSDSFKTEPALAS